MEEVGDGVGVGVVEGGVEGGVGVVSEGMLAVRFFRAGTYVNVIVCVSWSAGEGLCATLELVIA